MLRRARRFQPLALVAALVIAAVPAAAVAGRSSTTIGAGKVQGSVALQNAKGLTVYMWTGERHGRSSCYGTCLGGWSPVLTGGKVLARKGSGVNQKLLGTTRRKNGTLQVTYNHHPLYTNANDTKPGDDSGQGCTGPTGNWWMLNRRGNPIKSVTGTCQFY